MKRILIIIPFLLGRVCFSQKVTDSSFGKPILTYTVSDPWAMFMGTEGPLITVYETGKTIFWKDRHYKIVQLDKGEMDEFFEEMNLFDTFFSNSKFIQATLTTDQPIYDLQINFDTVKYFAVYGSMDDYRYARKNIPQQLSKVYQVVMNFDDDDAVSWIPDKIEIMLSDYSHSPEVPLQWPTNWPDLNSPETVTRQGGVISIYLDKKYFTDLKKLLKKRKEKQAFEINARKFYAGYRFPLPNLY